MLTSPAHTKVRRLWLSLILVAAGYTRTTNWAGVYREGEVFLIGLDSHFHMRRVLLTLASYPRVPHFDAWNNHPEGAWIDWPIGFDLSLATLCKLGGWLSGGALSAEAIAAVYNPLLGVGVCAVVFVLGRRLAGETAGLWAAALAAVLPILSGYSNVGRVDHHAAEPLLIAVPLWLFLCAMDGERRTAPWAGASLALAVGVWPGAIAVSGIAFASLLVSALWRGDARMTAIGRDAFAAATCVMLPLSALHPWLWQRDFGYYAPGWFQPLCLCVAWATFEALWRLKQMPRARRVAATLAVPVMLWLAAVALISPLRESILAAVGYVGRGEAQISQVHESKPLWTFGWTSLHDHYTALAYLWFALPVVWWRRRGDLRFRFAGWWLGGGAALAIMQLRLGSLFAPLWCVAWGVVAVDVGGWLAVRVRSAVRIAAAAVALLFVIVPVLPQYARGDFSGTPEFVQSYGALMWLRERAAHAGDVMASATPPAFAVMSRWQWGHWITLMGEQANVANPLGQTAANLRGVRDSAAFYLSRDPEVALEMLARRDARYVLSTPLTAELEGMARHTGASVADFVDAQGGLTRGFFETTHARLHLFDARRVMLDGVIYPPLRRMRLVYESPNAAEEGGRNVAYAKVFERVAGAELRGTAPPGARVLLRLGLRTNTGRESIYRDEVIAEDGTFRLRVPYANGAVGVASQDAYHLSVEDREIGRAVVSEEDVVLGRAVAVTPR